MSEDVSLIVLDMIFSYWKTQMLPALATLSIADILAKGPATLESLTEQTGANKDGLARLLRAAASIGMVGYSDGCYLSTSRLDVLRGDAPVSLKAMAIAQGAPGHWLPWGCFPNSVMTGEAQSKAALGHAHFDYYARNPEEAGQFIKAMQGSSELVQGEVVRLLDIEGAKMALDVEGRTARWSALWQRRIPILEASFMICRIRAMAALPTSRSKDSRIASESEAATSSPPRLPRISIC